MRLLPNLAAAFDAVRGNGRRSLLSALGVSVATFAIVVLTAIAVGVRKEFADQVEDLGVGILIVLPGRLEDGMNINLGGGSYLKPEDGARIAKLPGVRAVCEFTFVGGAASYDGKQAPGFLIASTPEWFRMRKWELAEGRLMTEADAERPVVVVGGTAKQAIFPHQTALGKKLRINGRDYEIIGVTRDKKADSSLTGLGSLQNAIYTPYGYQRKVEPQSQTDRIFVQIVTGADSKPIIAAIERTLGRRLDRSQFSVLTQEDLLKLVFRFMGVLTWLVSGLTSIALVIGGLGIMTVMLLAVGERTGEIGIRMAVGATRGDIFVQFLAESVLLSAIGSVGGLLFGAAVSAGLDRFSPVHPLIAADLVVGTIAVGLCAGALFGLLPARKASRLDPATAIRSV